MAAIGVENASQLVTLLIREGLLEYTEARKVFRWCTGESAPNHEATVMLLERAGLLVR